MTPARIIAPSIAPKDLDPMRGLRKNRLGYVYVFGINGGTTFGVYLKIGFTVDVLRRYETIQRLVPWRLDAFKAFEGDEKLELSLHERFSRHREWGFPFSGTEWFRFQDEVADWFYQGFPL